MTKSNCVLVQRGWIWNKKASPKKLASLITLALMILTAMYPVTAFAQLSASLVLPDGLSIPVGGKNIARPENTLVLYNREFGPSTKTNRYGVEIIATPVSGNASALLYEVTSQTSVWQCINNSSISCGNAEIPETGIVLSATGDKRQFVLDHFKPGTRFVLQNNWFQQAQKNISAIDPTPLNNLVGSGFPGFRASHQLIVYTPNYGHATTQTNEFGFEVTVQNGIVTAQEGSDSSIPADGFVLSGHGAAREWLIRNAPLGSKISLDLAAKTISAGIDFGSYAYQFDNQWKNSLCTAKTNTMPNAQKNCELIQQKRQEAATLFQDNKPELAAQTISNALQLMNKTLWGSYQLFPTAAIKGAWHRPVEKSVSQINATLDRLKQAGINTIFLETFFHGYTIFPSKTYQQYGLPAQNPKFAGLDLLQAWVDAAHQRNMKIHTWFQTFYVGTTAFNPPGPILKAYPSWANVQFSALQAEPVKTVPVSLPLATAVATATKTVATTSASATTVATTVTTTLPAENSLPPVLLSPKSPTPSTLERGGYFLDPGNPAAKSFLMTLIKEIVTQYDIDGFQLDYIRYPASFPADRFSYRKTTWGYTDVTRNAFQNQYGIDPAMIDPKNPDFQAQWLNWNRYKTTQVNQFVQEASGLIRAVKPKLVISAAVFPKLESAKSLKHQDWAFWASNGWVDCFTPMTLTSALKVVNQDTREMVSSVTGTAKPIPVYSGLFGPFNNNSADQVLDQIKTAQEAGASGYVLFDTAHLTNSTLEALQIAQVSNPNLLSDSALQNEAVLSNAASGVSAKDKKKAEKAAKKHKKGWWIFRF